MQFMTWERQRAYDFEAGAQQKAVEAAENMMKKNYLVDDICEITGFSLEEVLELKEKIAVKA